MAYIQSSRSKEYKLWEVSCDKDGQYLVDFLAKIAFRNQAHTLKIPAFYRFSGSHSHNFELTVLFCPSMES